MVSRLIIYVVHTKTCYSRAGVPRWLAAEDATASLRPERSAIADGQERFARGALPRHRNRNVFPVIRAGVEPTSG
jgi:hypothetical protein